jgi:protein-L-isoaspartate(D-aspartate) O-methyltransferase
MNLEKARFNMVEQQIRTWMVLEPAALSVLSTVEREKFTPPPYQSLAYADTEIPLAHGQTMLPPRIDARLMHDLHLQGHETVLEIGTGSGYLTALLAHRAHQVISLEIHPDLAQSAQANLRAAGVHNADVRVGHGATDRVAEAPFDAIVLGGSVAEVPQSLLNQLKVGGKLIAIVGGDPIMHATLFTRVADQQWQSRALWDTAVPALEGFVKTSSFKF